MGGVSAICPTCRQDAEPVPCSRADQAAKPLRTRGKKSPKNGCEEGTSPKHVPREMAAKRDVPPVKVEKRKKVERPGSSTQPKAKSDKSGRKVKQGAEAPEAGAQPKLAKTGGKGQGVMVEEDEATRARKELQRARQKEALALRAAGQAYTKPKRQRKPKERRKFEERSTSKLIEKRELGKKLRREKKLAPEVVVIPIFWKGQAGQRGQVLSVCADLQKLLAEAGRRVEMDAGHKYTPGQKFAHWEHRGVKLRVEVGPREAERGCCTVARTFTPGEPAHRLEGVETAALLRELDFLAGMKEEERDAAADRAVRIKAQTHNGQIFIPSDAHAGGETQPDPPAETAAAPKRAKLVKF